MIPSMTQDDPAIRAKRLRYRSWHRGTKELDLLLGPYADRALPGRDSATLDLYEQLLELPEPLLYALLSGSAEPEVVEGRPEGFDALVLAIRAFHAEPKEI